jgi:hypothetical protein
MARKRQPLTFSELEARGRGAILRTREEIEAEEAALAQGITQLPDTQISGFPETRTPGNPETGPRVGRAAYQKVTYRISPEAVEAVDQIRRLLRQNHGLRVSREEIAEAALLHALKDLQSEGAAGFLALWFSGNLENQH